MKLSINRVENEVVGSGGGFEVLEIEAADNAHHQLSFDASTYVGDNGRTWATLRFKAFRPTTEFLKDAVAVMLGEIARREEAELKREAS